MSKETTKQLLTTLEELFPNAKCELNHKNTYELAIAVIMSAQTTDERVNKTTPELFNKYPTIESLAVANQKEVEEIIKSVGLYQTKAKNIIAFSKKVVDEYQGIIPNTIDELVLLPGVGRKTANLVVGDVYGKPAVVCDTHCIRITNLLGFTDTKDPAKCEIQLREILDPKESNNFCHRMVLHGRAVCIARRPQCAKCVLNEICEHAQKTTE